MYFDIVVVGGSTAGFYLVKELRSEGFSGSIGLIEKEDSLPYNRYKLSKDWMLSDDLNAPVFKPELFFMNNKIKIMLNTEVTSILKDQKKVVTASRKEIEYGKLVIAIGSEPRHLKINHDEAEGVFYLRNYHDALAIKEWSKRVKNVVLIGAGFIGLELTSSLRKRGLNVTVVEYSNHPLGRVVGADVSQYFVDMHQDHNVEFRLGTSVKNIQVNDQNEVKSVVTDSGETIACEMIIIGVGAVPNESITSSPFEFSKNITVNKFNETDVKDIYAVGDCTIWPFRDEMVHVEHWENAQNQGKNLATNLLATHSVPYETIPYFWTDQYDQTFEYLGHAVNWDHTFVRGDLTTRRYTIAYVDKDNVPLAILFANGNDQREDVTELMTKGKAIDQALFEDAGRNLAEI
ncbi:NAD(P)/FAD-dependent oxidoreductase [Pediococcus stilesii]|uniref:NAD(P)/FAD-dependent oxidoreductase n=1 Tax=Pediococcus stilesii TaxID=331679 RepID=A0A0R2KT37_9LACO|nr:FAD-dependent oxidoreductase [Pediococcus stilesii]KRN92594.1 hypothetical protein IV81_GL001149 [Pediococcus stilesii]